MSQVWPSSQEIQGPRVAGKIPHLNTWPKKNGGELQKGLEKHAYMYDEIVFNTKIKDTAISEALQEMWKTDFTERQSEMTALSKEDREFMGMMKKNVVFKEGHYELPLPIKKDTIHIDKEVREPHQLLERIRQGQTEDEFEKTVSYLS